MSTAAMVYQVTSNQISQIKSSVLKINYTDANGVNQVIPEYSSASGVWTLPFTGTVGQQYAVSAVEIQSQPPQGVTITVLESGSSVATANNFANTALAAGVTGTI